MIKQLAVLAGLFVAATTHAAAPNDATCMPMSEYQFQIANDQVIAMSDSRAPHSVVMKDGKLFVENQWVTLSKDDAQRVRNIEKSLRALEPKIQAENERLAIDQLRDQVQRDKAERRFRIGPMGMMQSSAGQRVMEGMADQMLGVMGDLMRGMQTARRTGNTDDIGKIVSQLPFPSVAQGFSTQLCRDYQALNEQDNALTYRYNREPIELLRVMEPNFR